MQSKLHLTPGTWLLVEVDGALVPKARPRVTATGTYMPAGYRACLSKVVAAVRHALAERPTPWSTRLSYYVVVYVVCERANSGDVDNMAGTILDACSHVLWEDDRQIVQLVVSKKIATDKEPAHVTFSVSAAPHATGFEPPAKAKKRVRKAPEPQPPKKMSAAEYQRAIASKKRSRGHK